MSNRNDSKKYIIDFDRNVLSSIFKFKDFFKFLQLCYIDLTYNAFIFIQFQKNKILIYKLRKYYRNRENSMY